MDGWLVVCVFPKDGWENDCLAVLAKANMNKKFIQNLKTTKMTEWLADRQTSIKKAAPTTATKIKQRILDWCICKRHNESFTYQPVNRLFFFISSYFFLLFLLMLSRKFCAYFLVSFMKNDLNMEMICDDWTHKFIKYLCMNLWLYNVCMFVNIILLK